ncbi:hypothetical protein [Ruania halotolerans]|uniref:hypothetical protein n=1 Tax=Ruania halotolerans TaxID=2897773 RepID=UPI001E32DBAB|nr:hypothetical protein [Ruania halotolerans]UFU05922.1 hypothetical protein LQF10_16050 [Ruania halotolerans]
MERRMISGAFRAVVTAAAAAGIGITAFGDRAVLVGTIAGIVALFAIGWPTLLELPARRGGVVVLLITAAAALTALLVWDDLLYVAVALGLSVVGAFVHEMFRRDGRPRLVESVSGVVTGAVVVASAAGWLAVGTGEVATALLLVGAVTLTLGSACTALPIPGWLGSAATLVIAAAAGLLTGSLIDAVGLLAGGLVGLSAGVLIAAVHALFGQFPASGRPTAALAAAMLPVAVSGVPVYVLGRVLLG